MADNKDTTINCPACGKPMKKIYMPAQGVNLDVCVDGCGGIYFDNREFSKFDEPSEDISPLNEVLKDKEFIKVDENITRVCPVCGSDMVKNYASSKQEVQVDECYHCGGKFLDYGELDKIRSQYNTEGERSADVMKKLYSDVGVNLIDRQALTGTYRQQQGKSNGLKIGIILALIWLIYKNSIITNAFNGNFNNIEFAVVISVAIAIVLICIGIGSIIGRTSK
jgi:Zn-finger nucleic acid-binding protein